MFFIGDLNSGISKALAESKLVACFVTNGDEESQLWENDFLQDPELKLHLSNKAVLLRLEAGSQEADYLAAIFPIPKVPTIVVIQNGELKEYLAAGPTLDKTEFTTRLGRVLGAVGGSTQSAADSTSTPPPSITSQQTVIGTRPEVSNAPSNSTASPGSAPASQPAQARRAENLSSDSNPQESKVEKSNAAAKGKAPEKAPEKTPSSGTSSYAATQKKLQQDAKEERARVLKRIEDDRIARRARDAEQKAQASDARIEKSTSHSKAPTPRSQNCAIQIRLFDGSTIRKRFSTSSNLHKDVRHWIDEQQPNDVPYIFKQVLTPLPNRNLSISDESVDLESLGLTPSATLIIVPVQTYTSAYEGTNPAGLISRGVSAGFGLGVWGLNTVVGTMRNIVAGPARGTGNNRPEPTSAAPATNLSSLRDRDSENQQLYNGNTLNFEPRKDDADEDDRDR